MANNILFISYDGMTDQLGQSQVLPYLIGLSKAGYQIHLLSCEKAAAYKETEDIINTICKDNNIIWHPINYTKKPPLLSTLYDMRRLKKRAKQIHKAFKINIVHCRSYIPSIIGSQLKRKYGIKLIFDMRGFWADERIDGNIWNLKNPIFNAVYKYFKTQEKSILQLADYTVCLTQAAKDEIYSWNLSNNTIPITVIPCCVDLEHFDPDKISLETKDNLREKLHLSSDDCILSYIGSIGTWYLLDEMLCFFRAFCEQKPNARFLFITQDDPVKITERVTQYNIDPAKIVISKGSRKDMPVLISLSTYSIFFIKPAYSKKASSPTKQGEIMRLGIPVICNDNIGDTSLIINKYQAGIIVSSFNDLSYKEAVSRLLNTPFTRESMISGAFDTYNLQMGIKLYKEIYKSLL